MTSTADRALIGSIQKFSIEDGPGIRTTVFLKGCPLNCAWCHNPELIDRHQQLIQSRNNCIGCGCCIDVCPEGALRMDPEVGIVVDRDACTVCLACADQCYAKALRPVAKIMTADEVLAVVEQDKDFYETTGGGMTISGGEVLEHAAFATQLIEGAAARGINVCLDTCGLGTSEQLMDLALRDNVTTVLYDVKSVDEKVHRAYTGVGNELIMSNLRMLAGDARTADKLIVRMPLIAGVNDGDELIKRTGAFYHNIGLKRVTLLPYHNLGVSKQRNLGGEQQTFEEPSEERIDAIAEFFSNQINLDVQILGKV